MLGPMFIRSFWNGDKQGLLILVGLRAGSSITGSLCFFLIPLVFNFSQFIFLGIIDWVGSELRQFIFIVFHIKHDASLVALHFKFF